MNDNESRKDERTGINYLGTDANGAHYTYALPPRMTVRVDPVDDPAFLIDLRERGETLREFVHYVERRIGWDDGPKLASRATLDVVNGRA